MKLQSGWVLALLILTGCDGPMGPISGGELGGPVVLEFDDWSFASAAEQIQLESADAEGGAYSVNVWSGVVDGRLFVPTSLVRGADDPAERQWVRNARARNRVRVRIDGEVHVGTIRRVEDEVQLQRREGDPLGGDDLSPPPRPHPLVTDKTAPGLEEDEQEARGETGQGQCDEAAAKGAGHVSDLSTPRRGPSPRSRGGLAGSEGPCYGLLFVR